MEANATSQDDAHTANDLASGSPACSPASIERTFAGDMIRTPRVELLICSPSAGMFGYAGIDFSSSAPAGRDGSFSFHHEISNLGSTEGDNPRAPLHFWKTPDHWRRLNDRRVGRRKRQEAVHHRLQFFNVADDDLRNETIVSRDTISLDDLGRVSEHLRNALHFTRHCAHPDVGRDVETKRLRVCRDRVAGDRTDQFPKRNVRGTFFFGNSIQGFRAPLSDDEASFEAAPGIPSKASLASGSTARWSALPPSGGRSKPICLQVGIVCNIFIAFVEVLMPSKLLSSIVALGLVAGASSASMAQPAPPPPPAHSDADHENGATLVGVGFGLMVLTLMILIKRHHNNIPVSP